jgi:hypothetical protein
LLQPNGRYTCARGHTLVGNKDTAWGVRQLFNPVSIRSIPKPDPIADRSPLAKGLQLFPQNGYDPLKKPFELVEKI